MNLLIVDDDLLALQGISSMVNKETLGICQIFCASRVQEAKEIFQNTPIDLLLCDIEMPMENGLELMEWIQMKKFSVTMMVLTSHADFSYSMRAIRTGSIDYLLKPVSPEDLHHALQKAIAAQKEKQHLSRDSRNWRRVSKSVTEYFFKEVISCNFEETPEFFIERAKQQSISLKEGNTYLPILFCIKKYSPSIEEMDEPLIEFILKNIAYEVFQQTAENIVCVSTSDRSVLILLYDSIDYRTLAQTIQSYLEAFYSYCGAKLCGYQGKAVFLENLSSELFHLQRCEFDHVSCIHSLIVAENFHCPDIDFSKIAFPYDELIQMVQNNQEDHAFSLLEQFLKHAEKENYLYGSILKKMQNDLLQSMYVLLKEHGIQAHLLFDDPESLKRFHLSLLTVSYFLEWSRHLIAKTCQMIQFSKNDQSLVKQAEQYIKQNLETIIGCKEVASQMYLTPDYLSRLFKEEKGITLQKYIHQEKIEKAKHLLATTNLSISIVAQLTGFTHFSHFSMTFRKATGLSPADYRKQGKVVQKGGETL